MEIKENGQILKISPVCHTTDKLANVVHCWIVQSLPTTYKGLNFSSVLWFDVEVGKVKGRYCAITYTQTEGFW